VLFILVIAVIWQGMVFLNTPASEQERPFVFEVKKGVSFSQISNELEELGAVSSATKFKILGRILGVQKKVRVGEYELKSNFYPREVISMITSGKSLQRTFTVQEGLNRYEIAQNYENQKFGLASDFLKWTEDRAFIQSLLGENIESLEGYLYPETYALTKYMTAKDLVEQMVKNFLSIYSEIDKPEQINLSRHQIITLASIVEKETGAPEERPIISSVFHNRMRKGMRLQTDPTVMYGITDITKKPVMNITKKDLLTPTRYNTYTMSGLPIGPIANAGKQAIVAALNPESSDFLYFVSKNDGTHVFSESYEKHNSAVGQFQIDRKAREGKSWRDLKKKRN
jgi:UPF0755 protein